MKFNGHIELNSNATAELQNAYIERVSTTTRDTASGRFAAGTVFAGRIIFNTTTGTYQYRNLANDAWLDFASGGDATALQTEINNIETASGGIFSSTGTFDGTGLDALGNIAGSTSLLNALTQLDTAISNAAGVDTLAELTDVTITSSAANELLFTTGANTWVNYTLAEAGIQPLDATLTALAGLTTAADQMVYSTGVDTFAMTSLTSYARTLIDDANAAAARTTLGVVIGTDVQPNDAFLTSIASLGTAANKMIYTTGVDTAAETTVTSLALSLLDDVTTGDMQTTLALVIGTNVQAYDATLSGLASLAGTGIVVETATDVFTNRSLQAPAAGITITNPAGLAGNPTFALANDLAALEGLTTTGYIIRTGDGTAIARSIAGTAGNIDVTNGDGIATDTNINLATVSQAASGSFVKVTLDGFGRVTGNTAVLTADITALVDATYVNVTGDTMSGNLVMGNNEVTGLPSTPTGPTAAASKAYVDALVTSSTTWRDPITHPDLLDIVTAVPGSPVQYASYIAYGGSYPQTWGGLTDVASGDILEHNGSAWVRIGTLSAGDRFIAGGETGTIGATLAAAGVRHVDLIQYVSGAPTAAASWTKPHVDTNQAILFTNDVVSGTTTGLTNDATLYTMDVKVNATTYNVSVVGSASQTIGTLLTEINADLTGATATIVSGHIHITGAVSTDAILITDTGLIAAIGGGTGTTGNGIIHGSADPGTTVLCNTVLSQHLSHTYLFSGGADGDHNWIEVSGPGAINAGLGLAYSGNTLNVNMGAGIVQLPSDEVGIDLYDEPNGALILTTDGSAHSTVTGAKLHLKLDAAGALAQTASGLKIDANSVTNAMIVNDSNPTNADSGTGSMALGATLTVTGNATQGVVTSVSGSTFNVTASTATSSQLGVAKFNTGDFVVTAGDVTIKALGVGNAQLENSVMLFSDGATPQTVDLGGTLTVAATAGTGVAINTTTADTITIAGINASTTVKGVAVFDSADFDVASGSVTIKALGVDNSQLANSTVTIAGDTGSDAVALGETLTFTGAGAIDTAMAANVLTISVVDATTAVKGVASFNSAQFSVTSGAVSLAATTNDLTDVTAAASAVGQMLVANGSNNYVPSLIQFVYSGTSATSHTVTHNLGQKYCNVTVVDASDEVIIPQSITYNSTTGLTVVFNTAIACKVIVMGIPGVGLN